MNKDERLCQFIDSMRHITDKRFRRDKKFKVALKVSNELSMSDFDNYDILVSNEEFEKAVKRELIQHIYAQLEGGCISELGESVYVIHYLLEDGIISKQTI